MMTGIPNKVHFSLAIPCLTKLFNALHASFRIHPIIIAVYRNTSTEHPWINGR